MSIVALVSGGFDSSLIAILAKEEGIEQFPLFINYGQLGYNEELRACEIIHAKYGLAAPKVMDLSGFGHIVSSGITNKTKDIFADAFLPGRNMLFLLAGYAYAYEKNAAAVSIGLLNEQTHIFPDQTQSFLKQAESILSLCTGMAINIIAPLMSLYKSDILQLAQKYGLSDTYSCHSGRKEPCGICISCREILSAKKEEV